MIGAIAAIVATLIQLILDPSDPNGCSHCSYNLTGNVSGVCPECGTAITPVGLPAEVLKP